MPKPSAQLAKFEPMLGTWSGKGVARDGAGSQSQPWTATMTIQRVLDGFAVQEDLIIEFGAPTPFLMRTIYGFDSSSQTPSAVAMSNEGHLNGMGYEFDGDGILVVYGIDRGSDGKGTGVGRSRVEFTKDSYKFVHDGSRGAGAPFVEVEGEFKRHKGDAPKAVDVAVAKMPLGAEMKSLGALAGAYQVSGKMLMMPGAPVMDVTGVDSYLPLYGGMIMQESVAGDPTDGMPSYVSHAYIGWNSLTSNYDWFVFDNMGVATHMISRWTKPGTEMVAAGCMVSMGSPVSANAVITAGEQGITAMKCHTLWGANEPMVSFDAKFTRK